MPPISEVSRHLSPLSSQCFPRRVEVFAEFMGDKPVEEISIFDLLRYREFLVSKYADRTALGYLNAAKRLVRWAASMHLRQAIDFSAIPPISISYQPKQAWTPKEVRRLLESSKRLDPRAEAWGRLQYLTATRPSEVVRIVNGEAMEIGENMIALPEHKTATRSKLPRYVLLSSAAKQALEDAKQSKPKRKRSNSSVAWSRLDSYSNAFRVASGQRPHRLRHAAAQSLISKGATRQDADLLLGHAPGNIVSLAYMPVMEQEYLRLLPLAESLSDDLKGGQS